MSLVVGTVLDEIQTSLEKAGDDWRLSLDAEAVAENTYRRSHAIAWVRSGDVAITARAKHCENQPEVVEDRCTWNLAIAREKACHSKVEEQRSRMMAAQSNLKYLGRADGGNAF